MKWFGLYYPFKVMRLMPPLTLVTFAVAITISEIPNYMEKIEFLF